jgi:hypothetical protein
MQATELVHLAALIAVHGAPPDGSRFAPSQDKLGNYWSASKCRIDRWLRALRPDDGAAWPRPASVGWKPLRGIIEEILLSEVLTRVWTAFLLAHDQTCGREEAESVARSVLMGQLEARRRALSLLMHAAGVPIGEAVAVNRLRCKTERWTDLLLGQLSVPCDLSELAADVQRVRDFALERQTYSDDQAAQRWSLLLTSLRQSFPSSAGPRSPNSDLNERIAASVLACFPTEAFESTGLFRSLWMIRLRYATDDAQGILDQLCRGLRAM